MAGTQQQLWHGVAVSWDQAAGGDFCEAELGAGSWPSSSLRHSLSTHVPSLAPLCSCPSCWAQPWLSHSAQPQQGLRFGQPQAPRHSSLHPAGRECHPLPPVLSHPAARFHLCDAWQCHVLGCPADTDLSWLPTRRRFYQTISVLQIVRWNAQGSECTSTLHKLSNGVTPSAAVSRGTSQCMFSRTGLWLPSLQEYTVWKKWLLFLQHIWLRILCCRWCCHETCGYSFALHYLFLIFFFPERHLQQVGENDLNSISPPEGPAFQNKAWNFIQDSIHCILSCVVMKDLWPFGTKEAVMNPCLLTMDWSLLHFRSWVISISLAR